MMGLSSKVNSLRRQAGDFLDIIYPPACGLCGQPAETEDRLICRKCWDSVETLEAPYCLECREFMLDRFTCPHCSGKTITVFSLGYFDSTLRSILHDLKFNGLKPLARPLGDKLAELIMAGSKSPGFDLIAAVPLHYSRQYLRGFNQAEEIALELSRSLGVPLAEDILVMTRKTRQQARLSASRRAANVKGAYALGENVSGLSNGSILLVDDVITTGATIRENARVLMAGSARKVTAAVIATAS